MESTDPKTRIRACSASAICSRRLVLLDNLFVFYTAFKLHSFFIFFPLVHAPLVNLFVRHSNAYNNTYTQYVQTKRLSTLVTSRQRTCEPRVRPLFYTTRFSHAQRLYIFFFSNIIRSKVTTFLIPYTETVLWFKYLSRRTMSQIIYIYII